jgi:hypothetical protein
MYTSGYKKYTPLPPKGESIVPQKKEKLDNREVGKEVESEEGEDKINKNWTAFTHSLSAESRDTLDVDVLDDGGPLGKLEKKEKSSISEIKTTPVTSDINHLSLSASSAIIDFSGMPKGQLLAVVADPNWFGMSKESLANRMILMPGGNKRLLKLGSDGNLKFHEAQKNGPSKFIKGVKHKSSIDGDNKALKDVRAGGCTAPRLNWLDAYKFARAGVEFNCNVDFPDDMVTERDTFLKIVGEDVPTSDAILCVVSSVVAPNLDDQIRTDDKRAIKYDDESKFKLAQEIIPSFGLGSDTVIPCGEHGKEDFKILFKQFGNAKSFDLSACVFHPKDLEAALPKNTAWNFDVATQTLTRLSNKKSGIYLDSKVHLKSDKGFRELKDNIVKNNESREGIFHDDEIEVWDEKGVSIRSDYGSEENITPFLDCGLSKREARICSAMGLSAREGNCLKVISRNFDFPLDPVSTAAFRAMLDSGMNEKDLQELLNGNAHLLRELARVANSLNNGSSMFESAAGTGLMLLKSRGMNLSKKDVQFLTDQHIPINPNSILPYASQDIELTGDFSSEGKSKVKIATCTNVDGSATQYVLKELSDDPGMSLAINMSGIPDEEVKIGLRNYVAYQISRELNVNVIPTTGFLKVDGKWHMAMERVGGKNLGKVFEKNGWNGVNNVMSNPNIRKGYSELGIVDGLICQLDRHVENILLSDDPAQPVKGIDNDQCCPSYTHPSQSIFVKVESKADAGTAENLRRANMSVAGNDLYTKSANKGTLLPVIVGKDMSDKIHHLSARAIDRCTSGLSNEERRAFHSRHAHIVNHLDTLEKRTAAWEAEVKNAAETGGSVSTYKAIISDNEWGSAAVGQVMFPSANPFSVERANDDNEPTNDVTLDNLSMTIATNYLHRDLEQMKIMNKENKDKTNKSS